MNEKVAKVLRGFINLSATEKAEFIRELTRYQSSGIVDKSIMERTINESASIGPKDSICTCCGR